MGGGGGKGQSGSEGMAADTGLDEKLSHSRDVGRRRCVCIVLLWIFGIKVWCGDVIVLVLEIYH